MSREEMKQYLHDLNEDVEYCQRCGKVLEINIREICGSCVDEIEHN